MTSAKTKFKHSKDLNLNGKPHADIAKFTINKNIKIPDNRWSTSRWDHLIAKLDHGDSIEMSKREATSFTSRARNLGYAIVLRTIDDDISRVWFDGLNPNHNSKEK